MWSTSKKSARLKGVDFDLDHDWFRVRLAAGICQVSGLPFDLTAAKRVAASPSVDRIDPKGPYTKANCRLILWWINQAFSNMGEDYAFGVFRAIFKHQAKGQGQ